MMDSVDDEGEDAGQNGQRDAKGGDTCADDNEGADIPNGAVSVRYLESGLRDTNLVSGLRTRWILAR
jgi:hypothetical protein